MDRCLRRHGGTDLKALLPRSADGNPAYPSRKDDAPDLVHVDVKYLPQLPDEDQRRSLFAVSDRATRRVSVDILPEKSAAGTWGCLVNFF